MFRGRWLFPGSLRYSFFWLLDIGLGKLADVLAARIEVGLFRLLPGCQRLGTGKLGDLRGFLLGSQLVCFLPFLALDAVLAILVTYPCLIGKLFVVFARADLALGKAIILYQRNMTGADIAARSAFDAIEQAEC